MSAAIRAGRAFVELFLKDAQLQAGLNRNIVRMQAWKASAEAMGVKMLGLGAAMTAPFAMATKAAGDMQQSMSKLNAVFGDQSQGTIAWMNEFTKSVGRGKKETADGLSSFQAFFRGLDVEAGSAANLSKEMATLAVDFASFHNMSDAEAIQRFISAMSGSSEVVDMFGINLKQGALDLKLLALGFPKVDQGATELQKTLARQSIIKDSMGRQGAIGDAIRTADEFANTYKRISGEVATAVAQIGATVMPVFRDLMKWFSESLKSVMEWANENKEMVVIAAKASIAFIALGGSLIILGQGLGAILTIVAAVKALGAAIAIVRAASLASIFTGLGVGIAVVGALAAAFSLLSSSVGEVSTTMQEQSATNAKLRSDDQVLMSRLKQLAEKQNLNNKEMNEAQSIINGLSSRYGDLGLSINGATGKIEGMTAAQAKLNEVMKAKQLHDLEMEAAQAAKNSKSKQAEAEGWKVGKILNPLSGDFWTSNQTKNEKRNEARDESLDWLEKERLLRKQIEALKGGKAEGPSLNPVDVAKREADEQRLQAEMKRATEDNFKRGEDASTELAKIEDDQRREKLTQLERDIEDTIRAGEERKRLIDSVMAGEGARPGGPSLNILEDMNARRDQVNADVENEIAAIKKKAADEEAARVAEATRAQTDQIAMKELELKFAARAGETEAQAAAREHAKQLELIELERQQALAGIKEGESAALLNRQFDLDKTIAEGVFNAQNVGRAEQKINAAGSFNAAVVGRIGQDSLDKQSVDLQKEIRDLLKKIEKKEGGLEFVNGV